MEPCLPHRRYAIAHAMATFRSIVHGLDEAVGIREHIPWK
jgi:hypothetical protein